MELPVVVKQDISRLCATVPLGHKFADDDSAMCECGESEHGRHSDVDGMVCQAALRKMLTSFATRVLSVRRKK